MTKTNPLKEKCLSELEVMLPYHELFFTVKATSKQITKIELHMLGWKLGITKGKKFTCTNHRFKIYQVLVDIYNEFEDEIQALFDLKV